MKAKTSKTISLPKSRELSNPFLSCIKRPTVSFDDIFLNHSIETVASAIIVELSEAKTPQVIPNLVKVIQQ